MVGTSRADLQSITILHPYLTSYKNMNQNEDDLLFIMFISCSEYTLHPFHMTPELVLAICEITIDWSILQHLNH